MASAGYTALWVLHILATLVLAAYLVVLPAWRMRVKRDGDKDLLPLLTTLSKLHLQVAVPALVALIATGVLMVMGPLKHPSPFLDVRVSGWTQGSIVLALVLAFMVYLGIGGPMRKMTKLVQAGEPTGPAMDKLWSEWRSSLISAGVLLLVALVLMIFYAPPL